MCVRGVDGGCACGVWMARVGGLWRGTCAREVWHGTALDEWLPARYARGCRAPALLLLLPLTASLIHACTRALCHPDQADRWRLPPPPPTHQLHAPLTD